jgi:hypothetical protein
LNGTSSESLLRCSLRSLALLMAAPSPPPVPPWLPWLQLLLHQCPSPSTSSIQSCPQHRLHPNTVQSWPRTSHFCSFTSRPATPLHLYPTVAPRDPTPLLNLLQKLPLPSINPAFPANLQGTPTPTKISKTNENEGNKPSSLRRVHAAPPPACHHGRPVSATPGLQPRHDSPPSGWPPLDPIVSHRCAASHQ